ncbi:hypothetical protein [Bradyrhizobium sp. 76]|uniref:hypothetical protein n=1 Tax=Bradyrhizobium sp. 76 TaxID=2782680 RepID=UPI001FF80535|nr:hypothetical protein [Bradyrhizobium sp. 76]MCK1407707.1 hypothetical protein [Bradyrhizobium sp. 76]
MSSFKDFLVRLSVAVAAVIVLGGATPWPEAIVRHVDEMSAFCEQVKGRVDAGPRITHGFLDSGTEFWVVDEANARCSGAETLFSNQGGSQVAVYLSKPKGDLAKAFEGSSYGTSIESVGDRSKIWLTVGGKLCEEQGDFVFSETISCERPLQFETFSQSLEFAPSSNTRFNDFRTHQASEAVPYDDGTILENQKAYVFQAYWRDRTGSVDWRRPVRNRGAIYNAPLTSGDGRNLIVTMLQSPSACDPLCPLRVITANHETIIDIAVCGDRAQHRLTADHRTFLACDKSFWIPQVSERTAIMQNAPAGSDREAYVRVVHEGRKMNESRPKPIHVDSAHHNKSEVLVSEWQDGSVEIRYDHPRPGLPVASGTLLFRGAKTGSRYVGTAYTFKAGCEPAAFLVSGAIDPGHNILVLTGDAPHRDKRSCDLIAGGLKSAATRLVFDARFYGDQ